jgi:hypothetical protein
MCQCSPAQARVPPEQKNKSTKTLGMTRDGPIIYENLHRLALIVPGEVKVYLAGFDVKLLEKLFYSLKNYLFL